MKFGGSTMLDGDSLQNLSLRNNMASGRNSLLDGSGDDS